MNLSEHLNQVSPSQRSRAWGVEKCSAERRATLRDSDAKKVGTGENLTAMEKFLQAATACLCSAQRAEPRYAAERRATLPLLTRGSG